MSERTLRRREAPDPGLVRAIRAQATLRTVVRPTVPVELTVQ